MAVTLERVKAIVEELEPGNKISLENGKYWATIERNHHSQSLFDFNIMIGVGGNAYAFANGRADKDVDFDEAVETAYYHLL